MAKLKRQVRRTKEVLSANSGAPFNVEELHEGRDYASHITRDTFEELAGDFWSRAAVSGGPQAHTLLLLQGEKGGWDGLSAHTCVCTCCISHQQPCRTTSSALH
jgi:hypothetical protein